jgi:hypothetical protein
MMREWAIGAGWNSSVDADAVRGNDFRTFAERLRRAARDGKVRFWALKYDFELPEDVDAERLVEIPKEHFVEFEFDGAQLARERNYNIFTGKDGSFASAWRGQTYRNLHVNPRQVRAWLREAGAPPAATLLSVKSATDLAPIRGHEPVCAIVIENMGRAKLDQCLVQLEQFGVPVPAGMPMPLPLRAETDVRSRSGKLRFTLPRKRPLSVPILFRGPVRKHEWYFLDDAGKEVFIPAKSIKMVVGIRAGTLGVKALVSLEVGAHWSVYAEVEMVPEGFQLSSGELPPGSVSAAAPT